MTILVDEREIKSFNFNGGECHIRLPIDLNKERARISANLFNSDDIMKLLLCVDALRRINPAIDTHLTIPYFPYARQDRVCHPGEALSIKVMANLINQLNCNTVTIIDPHSDVTTALINNCIVIKSAGIITNTRLKQIIIDEEMQLVSPDAGAEKKTREVSAYFSEIGHTIETFLATKSRDPKTGEISNSQLSGDVSNKNLIILDDICDGGRTFIELAKVLNEKGANNLYLYVTHGIFSNGDEELKKYFKHIYCYHQVGKNSSIDHEFITYLEGEKNAY